MVYKSSIIVQVVF